MKKDLDLLSFGSMSEVRGSAVVDVCAVVFVRCSSPLCRFVAEMDGRGQQRAASSGSAETETENGKLENRQTHDETGEKRKRTFFLLANPDRKEKANVFWIFGFG